VRDTLCVVFRDNKKMESPGRNYTTMTKTKKRQKIGPVMVGARLPKTRSRSVNGAEYQAAACTGYSIDLLKMML
jgi:hypothetical protein